MSVTSTRVEIIIGNIECKLVGAAPVEILDRELNPHLPETTMGWAPGGNNAAARVFDPAHQTFLIGALPQVKRILRNMGVRFRVQDRRNIAKTRHQWTLQGPPLRDYQKRVVSSALEAGMGIIDIGTGGGKTLLAAAIIAELGLPTLYIVTTRPLLTQAARNLSEYLSVSPGVIGNGHMRPRQLTVALIQALSMTGVPLEDWEGGCLIFDEGHHAAAPTYLELLKSIRARHNYYLSAVPVRSGTDQKVLDALTCGTLTDEKYSAGYLIEHGYACPARVRVEHSTIEATTTELSFRMIYDRFIVENSKRNRRIGDIAREEIRCGSSVLILVDRIFHGEGLKALIHKAGFIHGKVPKTQLNDLVEEFREGRLPCLIATSGLFQEGVSIDGINVLIHAGAMKSRTKVLQVIGRGLRRAAGKESVLFVDFFDDDDAGVLRDHSYQRFNVLREEGFHVPSLESIHVMQKPIQRLRKETQAAGRRR